MMTIKFGTDLPYTESASGKLANVELHFVAGPLEGLKLIGFGLWQRRTGDGFNVTFPARQYSVNGERRSFALLRPVETNDGQNRVRDVIVAAWREYVAAAAEAAEGDDSSPYKPEAAVLYDGTPGSASLPRPRKGGAR